VRRPSRRALGIGAAAAAAAYAAWRALERRRMPSGVTWERQPFPFPPRPREEPPAWVEPSDGACPATHPVKAKLASGIFHVTGGASYERTNADRCYASEDAAVADGLRPAQR
jgi:hypothetical protein